MRDVAVVIPTLRRPESLERALRSVFAQVGALDRVAAVVIADNDPDGSAAALIDRLRAEAPAPLVYAHAPVPGVATARNVGLAATDAPLIAFLDDDEAASPGWLAALLRAQVVTGADVVFGPIRGRVPPGTGWNTASFPDHPPDPFLTPAPAVVPGRIEKEGFNIKYCPNGFQRNVLLDAVAVDVWHASEW